MKNDETRQHLLTFLKLGTARPRPDNPRGFAMTTSESEWDSITRLRALKLDMLGISEAWLDAADSDCLPMKEAFLQWKACLESDIASIHGNKTDGVDGVRNHHAGGRRFNRATIARNHDEPDTVDSRSDLCAPTSQCVRITTAVSTWACRRLTRIKDTDLPRGWISGKNKQSEGASTSHFKKMRKLIHLSDLFPPELLPDCSPWRNSELCFVLCIATPNRLCEVSVTARGVVHNLSTEDLLELRLRDSIGVEQGVILSNKTLRGTFCGPPLCGSIEDVDLFARVDRLDRSLGDPPQREG